VPVYCLHLHPHNGGSKHLWKVGQFLRDYTAQHPRRQSSPKILRALFLVFISNVTAHAVGRISNICLQSNTTSIIQELENQPSSSLPPYRINKITEKKSTFSSWVEFRQSDWKGNEAVANPRCAYKKIKLKGNVRRQFRTNESPDEVHCRVCPLIQWCATGVSPRPSRCATKFSPLIIIIIKIR
jgi:hypothetical protein